MSDSTELVEVLSIFPRRDFCEPELAAKLLSQAVLVRASTR
jgi:hypothetical protein